MKPRLLAHLRCPACVSPLRLSAAVSETANFSPEVTKTRCVGICQRGTGLDDVREDCPECGRLEVIAGTLGCETCGVAYAVRDGVPRLSVAASPDGTRPLTASSFGYLWARSKPGAEPYGTASYHYAKMERSLSLDPPHGLVLDAGCGDGIDVANLAACAGVEIVGVELSDGGCETTYGRTRHLPHAHVVQADVCRLPFADATFDLAYSYGVLHHIGAPERGLREVARVAKRGGRVTAYLYEDFGERRALLGWLLRTVNASRRVTTRLPHWLLYGLCWMASPVVFVLFAVPAMLARRVPKTRRLAEDVPFRHATGPFSLVGDLYDRFSAPVEWRYSRAGSGAFFKQAGLEQISVSQDRGWMVTGIKPETGDGRD